MSICLRSWHTMRLDAKCRYFALVTSVCDLKNKIDFAKNNKVPFLILGSGSNIILPEFFPGIIIVNRIKGIEVVEKDDDFVFIRASSGQVWHDFVMYCLDNGYYGLENLSLIPGTVGASPVQNIGAYGREISDFFVSCQVLDTNSGKIVTFSKKECGFSYRSSFFKKKSNKGRYVILNVTFRLFKNPKCEYSYFRLNKYLKNNFSKKDFIPKNIAKSVIAIRKERLPNWNEVGTVGSFFVNPIVDITFLNNLLCNFSSLDYVLLPNKKAKIFAGNLLHIAGFSGYRKGSLMASIVNPIIICNNGKTSFKELSLFVEDLRMGVFRQFGVSLEVEPEIVSFLDFQD